MRIQVGTIGRPFGYRGEFFIADRDAAQELSINIIYLEEKPHRVESLRKVPQGVRLKLEGFTEDTQVKAKRGKPLFAEREDLPPPAEGEFWVEQLLGFEVREVGTSRVLGTLSEVEPVHGTSDRWWVTKEDGETFALPACKPFVKEINQGEKVIWIDNDSQFDS